MSEKSFKTTVSELCSHGTFFHDIHKAHLSLTPTKAATTWRLNGLRAKDLLWKLPGNMELIIWDHSPTEPPNQIIDGVEYKLTPVDPDE